MSDGTSLKGGVLTQQVGWDDQPAAPRGGAGLFLSRGRWQLGGWPD